MRKGNLWAMGNLAEFLRLAEKARDPVSFEAGKGVEMRTASLRDLIKPSSVEFVVWVA